MNRTLFAAEVLCLATLAPAIAAAQGQGPRLPPLNELTRNEYIFDTLEQGKIRVSVLVTGLKSPWALAFLPSGDALISERGGDLRIVHNAANMAGASARLDPQPIAGLPKVDPPIPRAGLHDILLHPQFAQNDLIYFTFNKPAAGAPVADSTAGAPGLTEIALFRAKLSGHQLTNVQQLFAGEPRAATGSRLAFGRDGMLYMTTGSMFDAPEPQHLDSAYGKTLRVAEDGKVPPDNPFVGRKGALPQIYTYGHSTQYGIAIQPTTGAVITAENGPNGGDELNLLLPGRNYGWPLVSYGLNDFTSEPVSASPVAEGIEAPCIVWSPSIVPSGLIFYTGDRFPAWKGNIFVGSIRRGRLPFTGGLVRVVLTMKLGDLREETLLGELRQRIRDVKQGPDGLIYVLSEDTGVLLRIEPAATGAPH